MHSVANKRNKTVILFLQHIFWNLDGLSLHSGSAFTYLIVLDVTKWFQQIGFKRPFWRVWPRKVWLLAKSSYRSKVEPSHDSLFTQARVLLQTCLSPLSAVPDAGWCALPYGTTRQSKQRKGSITTVGGEPSLWVIIIESRLTVRQLSHIHNSLHLSGSCSLPVPLTAAHWL